MGESNTSFDVGTGNEFSRPDESKLSGSGPLTDEQVDHFFTHGYVLARQLLTPSAMESLSSGAQVIEEVGIAPSIHYAKLKFKVWESAPVFKQLACESKISSAVCQLLPDEGGRFVLNNVYFRLAADQIGCGFHVDDPFFWPCPRDSPGPGVNIWMPLDDVDGKGGGLAFVPKSFTKEWLECRKAISDQTCEMAKLSPELNDRLERLKVEPEFKRGDVLFCTRFLFHRGCSFKPDADEAVKAKGIRRFSVRYMPGEALTTPMAFVDGKIVSKKAIKLADADRKEYPYIKP